MKKRDSEQADPDREAWEETSPLDPNRSESLNDLASALSERFNKNGDLKDLEECIQCYREAVELFPAPHPSRSSFLHALAYCLATRFDKTGDFNTLEEAIRHDQEALELRPPLHPNRSASLLNLGNGLLK